jgi:hypothetical protein
VTAQLVVGAVLVVVAVGVALLIRRRAPARPTAVRTYDRPAQLDPADLGTFTEWTVVLFSSAGCETCAGLRAQAAAAVDESVGFVEFEFGEHPEVHDHYGVDAVPMLLVVDDEGTVREVVVGPQPDGVVRALIARSREAR